MRCKHLIRPTDRSQTCKPSPSPHPSEGVKSNKGLNEQDKLAKTTEIQAQLDDLDRLNNALSAMSSVSKAVQ